MVLPDIQDSWDRDPLVDQHEPGPACAGDHCHHHNVDEPITDTTFRVCGECFHSYRTDGELLAADAIMRGIWPPLTNVDRIHSCPFCCHDW